MVVKYVKKITYIYRIYINILTFIYIRDVTRRVKPFPTLSSFRKKKKIHGQTRQRRSFGTYQKKKKEEEDHVGLWSTKFNHPLATNVTHGKLLVARLTIKGKLNRTSQYIIKKVTFMQRKLYCSVGPNGLCYIYFV